MGEASIFSVYLTTFIGIGFSIRKYNHYELGVSIPFIGFSIEFKKKTRDNVWFTFYSY